MGIKEPVLRLQKNADKTSNKIALPKKYVEKYGREFYMMIYSDGNIIIEPIKKGE